MAREQVLDYNLVEEEKNIIDQNLLNIIDIVKNVRSKFLSIEDNEELWMGDKADAFIDSIKNFFDKTADGQSIASRLEEEKNNINAFLEAVISETKMSDEMQAKALSVEE